MEEKKTTFAQRFKQVAIAMVLVVTATCGGATYWLYQRVFRSDDSEAADQVTVKGGTAVITAVRNLARLESAQFNIERVVDYSNKQTTLFGLMEVKDAILLVASGEVVAGVDLSEMIESDFEVDREKGHAVVTLPAPRIFSVRVDNERTYVHSRNTDLLAKRKDDLEAGARKHAEKSIRAAAQEGGILDHARKNAARTVESLVRSLGYTTVQIRWSDEE